MSGRIFIVGASGLIGSHLYGNFLLDYYCVGSHYRFRTDNFVHLDIRNKQEVMGAFKKYLPDIVLCPAAVSNVDYCEQYPVEARGVNIDGIKNVAVGAINSGAKMIFFSSDYIFNGKSGPYSEEDVPSPINEYGRQKVEAESFIRANLNNYLIIRTTVVYGWEDQGKNFVTNLLKNIKDKKKVQVPYDQVGSPTYADNLAKAVKKLIEENKTGIYNIAGTDILDRFSLAKLVCDVFEVDASRVVPVTTRELNQRAPRPLKAGLKTDKIAAESGIELIGARAGLNLMKNEKR